MSRVCYTNNTDNLYRKSFRKDGIRAVLSKSSKIKKKRKREREQLPRNIYFHLLLSLCSADWKEKLYIFRRTSWYLLVFSMVVKLIYIITQKSTWTHRGGIWGGDGGVFICVSTIYPLDFGQSGIFCFSFYFEQNDQHLIIYVMVYYINL